jgi:hypothetical protein
MTSLFLGAVQVALLAAASPAVVHSDRPPVTEVRMVCDQKCGCWQTRYRERRPLLADRPDLACPPPPVSGRISGYYNGYYRSGPATDIGFDNRDPIRRSSFPF